MTTQHSDSPRDATHKGEVLSDATDLEALLDAILGDELSPVDTRGRPRDALAARDIAADAPPGLAAAPPPAQVIPEPAFASNVVVADYDPWGFVSEDAQTGREIAHDFTPVLREAASVAPAGPLPTWRGTLRVSRSRQSLLVAALSAAALITASAISLREEPTPTQTAASSDTPSPVESSPLVQSVSAVRATDVAQVEVLAPTRQPERRSAVISRTPSRRSNNAPALRTSAPAKPAFVDAAPGAPAASPVIEAPSLVERIAQPTERDAGPSRTEIPAETEPRNIVDSVPDGGANDAAMVKRAEPVSTAPAPAAALRPTAARLVTGPAPEYPQALRTARIGGSVELLLTIDATGRVSKVQSVTGHPQLRSAAEAAVRRWRYEAARIDNLAVETQTMVRFNFDPSTDRRPQE